PTVESVLEEGREDIGSEALPEQPPGALESAGREARRGALALLQSLVGKPRTGGTGAGVLSTLQKWTATALSKVTPALEAARQKQLARLLKMLKENPDEGLKFALPLVASGHRGVAPPSAHLSERDVNFDLSRLSGGRAADAWSAPEHVQQVLRQEYRNAANRA